MEFVSVMYIASKFCASDCRLLCYSTVQKHKLVQMLPGDSFVSMFKVFKGLSLTLSFSHFENGGSKVFGKVELMCDPTECNNPLRHPWINTCFERINTSTHKNLLRIKQHPIILPILLSEISKQC